MKKKNNGDWISAGGLGRTATVINLGPFDQEEQNKYQKVVSRYEKLQNCFKNTRRECSV